MCDLIDRQDAIDAIDAGYDGVAEDDYDYGLQDGMNRARFIIEDLPALIRIPLLTCKDCEYWETGWSCGGALHYCPMVDGIHGPHFYCGYAEPRKDEYVSILKEGEFR